MSSTQADQTIPSHPPVDDPPLGIRGSGDDDGRADQAQDGVTVQGVHEGLCACVKAGGEGDAGAGKGKGKVFFKIYID